MVHPNMKGRCLPGLSKKDGQSLGFRREAGRGGGDMEAKTERGGPASYTLTGEEAPHSLNPPQLRFQSGPLPEPLPRLSSEGERTNSESRSAGKGLATAAQANMRAMTRLASCIVDEVSGESRRSECNKLQIGRAHV